MVSNFYTNDLFKLNIDVDFTKLNYKPISLNNDLDVLDNV